VVQGWSSSADRRDAGALERVGERQGTGGAGARCGWRERCAGVREVWSKRVSGTRARRRWSEARGVAAREQKKTGVASCEQKTGGVSKT
jgi:hypothetical protein